MSARPRLQARPLPEANPLWWECVMMSQALLCHWSSFWQRQLRAGVVSFSLSLPFSCVCLAPPSPASSQLVALFDGCFCPPCQLLHSVAVSYHVPPDMYLCLPEDGDGCHLSSVRYLHSLPVLRCRSRVCLRLCLSPCLAATFALPWGEVEWWAAASSFQLLLLLRLLSVSVSNWWTPPEAMIIEVIVEWWSE